MSFRLKTILGLVLIQGFFLALLFVVTISILQDATDNAISKRAHTAATLFAALAKDSLLSYDLATLDTYVDEILSLPEIDYVRIKGRQDRVLASGGHQAALAKPFVEDHEVRDVTDGIFDAFAEIREGGTVFGRVEIGLDIHFVSNAEASARQKLSIFSMLVVGMTAVFSFFLGQYLTRQLSALVLASRAFSEGDLDHRLEIASQDELGQAATAFNEMAEKLKTLYRDLEEEVRLNNAMFATSPSGILILDSTERVVRMNAAVEQLFQWDAQEIIGQSVTRLMPSHPPTRHASRMPTLPQTGWADWVGLGQEREAQRKDGTLFPIHLAVGSMSMHAQQMFVGIITDITHRRQAEEDRRQKHRAVEESPVGVIITDTRGVMDYVNPALMKIYGYDGIQALKGKDTRIFKSGKMPPHLYQTMWEHLTSGKAWTGELLNKRKDGSLVWVRQHVCPIREEDDSVRHYLSIQEDVTELRRYRDNLEETVRARTVELEQARDAAEAGAQAKAAFMANVSHEIRTPMNAVIGFSEVVLQDTNLSSQTAQHVQTILNASRALLGIINDILDVSKLESGKFMLETVCFHLPNALTDALRTVEHRAAEKNLALKRHYDAKLPLRIMGDPTRLRQVVLNLVGNAIKFTEKGHITLGVQPGERPDVVHFFVADTGIGMTKSQVANVFEAFAQADGSTTRRFGGTGLGTTISKQIVELMEGKIWAESTPGHGSTFHFTVHMPEATEQGACLFEEDGRVAESYLSPRLFRVLLAEDIEANATLATLRLAQQGHTVHWVKNGREAVEESLANSYDIVLMDVMMPDLDGLDATRAIRKREENTRAHLPVLALTAGVMREDHDNCLAAGMDAVEAKPIDFNQLFASMEQWAPPGAGTPNRGQPEEQAPQAEFDFSPLAGTVDHEHALKAWRVPEIYAKALVSFADERSQDAQTLEHLLRENPEDHGPAQGVAHALKGVAGNLAIDQVARLATAIDADLKSGHREAVTTRLPALQHALEEAQAAIGLLACVANDSDAPTQPFDAEHVQRTMQTLLAELETLDPDAIEPVLAQLADYVAGTDLAPLRRAVDHFEFDEAKVMTRRLGAKLGLTWE